MNKSIFVLVAFLVLSVGFSQRYQPNLSTVFEVNQAAAFTDGIVVECSANVLALFDVEFVVCVDTSMTQWDKYQLAQWSTYGLDGWTIAQSWQEGSNHINHYRFILSRREMLAIAIFYDELVIYVVEGM